MVDRREGPVDAGTIAYVLKGFPRMSETFIASEIFRLERAGLRLRLIVIKPRAEETHHPVVDRIRSRPTYLPPTTSLSGTPLGRWLVANLPRFLPGALRVVRRWPVGTVQAVLAALALAVRARKGGSGRVRAVFIRDLLMATAVADELRSEPAVRHLHAHFCHGATTVTWLASRITGIPFSFTAHAKDIYVPSLNPANLLQRKLRAARFVVTCTEANRRHLEQIEPAADLHRVYHGLNVDFEELLDAHHGASNGNGRVIRILAVGRLVPKKGFDVLVRACSILRRAGMAVELRIAGERGEAEAEIRFAIAEHEMENAVTLLGPLSQRQLYDEYTAATMFCLPCRIADDGDRDGVPNVMVEAMSCGLPVVSTHVSGIPELVEHEVNGVLVAPDDAGALAEGIRRLAADDGLRARLGAAARATVRREFDGGRSAATLASLFRRGALETSHV